MTVEKGLLTLSGKRKSPEDGDKDSKKTTVYAKERFDGEFRRVVSLPEDADPARVDASYRNGVLKVVVPRLESAKRDASAQVELATASATAIRLVAETIGSDSGPMMYLLGEKYIASLENLAGSGNAKMVVLPADLQATLGGLLGKAKL